MYRNARMVSLQMKTPDNVNHVTKDVLHALVPILTNVTHAKSQIMAL